jgi:nickel-dependent lactate racemase
MHVTMRYGLDQVELTIPEEKWVASRPPPVALADPAAAVRAALEQPHAFPPLRRALTPDDRIAVVVDVRLPRLTELLVPLLEHIVGAGVAPAAITLLCSPDSGGQEWLEDLPDTLQDVHVEVFDPADRRRLSYLATTREGKRLYLSRTVVDADQVIVLTGRRYDPVLGHGGAEGALYPALSDEKTRAESASEINLGVPGAEAWPARQLATEASWLLGAPFFVQVIEAGGDGVAHVVTGTADASQEGNRLLDACWRQDVARPADVVVASISGDPSRHTFADLAAAAACAARVVRPDGRIILLSQAEPALGPGGDFLREVGDPLEAERALQGRHTLDMVPALRWSHAAAHARISLLSGLPGETVEELFATPLEHPGQVQRLLDAANSCLFLPDAHRTLAILSP